MFEKHLWKSVILSKHFANKNQLPGSSINGTLVENRLKSLRRITAYANRFIKRTRKKQLSSKELTAEEINIAETSWILAKKLLYRKWKLQQKTKTKSTKCNNITWWNSKTQWTTWRLRFTTRNVVPYPTPQNRTFYQAAHYRNSWAGMQIVEFHINSHNCDIGIGYHKDELPLLVFWDVWNVFAIKQVHKKLEQWYPGKKVNPQCQHHLRSLALTALGHYMSKVAQI